MKLDLKGVLKPAAILFVICVIVSAALAGTDLLTKDKIAEAAQKKAEESRKIVLPAADLFEAQADGQQEEYYLGFKDGEPVGYVFETSAKGYGGDVEIMTGITADGTISGVVILSHGETPGLGANAEKEEFRAQYEQAVPQSGMELVKYQTPGEGQVEAMTGATITSTAVTNAVNQAIDRYHSISEGGEYDGS